MFNYLGLRTFCCCCCISDNVLRLDSESAIKRFSNLIIGVAINAGQLHRLRDNSFWRRNEEMSERIFADGP